MINNPNQLTKFCELVNVWNFAQNMNNVHWIKV